MAEFLLGGQSGAHRRSGRSMPGFGTVLGLAGFAFGGFCYMRYTLPMGTDLSSSAPGGLRFRDGETNIYAEMSNTQQMLSQVAQFENVAAQGQKLLQLQDEVSSLRLEMSSLRANMTRLDTTNADSAMCASLSSGLVAHYHMDANGNNLPDSAGGSHDGTLMTGASVISDGVWGHAIDFSSFSGAALPKAVCVSGSQPRTIAFWFRGTSLSASDFIGYTFGFGQAHSNCNTDGSFNGRFSGQGHLAFMGCSADYDDGSAGVSVADGTWHHVAYTYNDHILTTYVDGHFNWRVSKTLSTNCEAAWIAHHNDISYNSPDNRQIDEFRIYSRALTTVEIMNLIRDDTVTHCH